MLKSTPALKIDHQNVPLNLKTEKNLTAIYQAAIDTRLPIALWHHPNRDARFAVVDFNPSISPTRIDFTGNRSGFAFSPFVNTGKNGTIFINASLYATTTEVRLSADADNFPTIRTDFLARYQQLMHQVDPIEASWRLPVDYSTTTAASKEEFCTLVKDAIGYIKQSGIKKIVASRATETPLPPNFNPLKLFTALSERYPHAFVSLVSIPGIGTWIGASPELLLSLRHDSLQTVALAGTQARPADKPLETVRWGQKEIEEQALVSDYIRDFFHDIGLRTFHTTGPRTVSAGNVVHLQTTFTITDTPTNLHHLANQILYRLHPTSAVCGMPKNEALSFILEKEKYNRAFYSGFLGPVHLDGESRLHVNLRCMQLKTRSAVLYVGAGITADSDPAAEWEETILKSKTLLSVL